MIQQLKGLLARGVVAYHIRHGKAFVRPYIVGSAKTVVFGKQAALHHFSAYNGSRLTVLVADAEMLCGAGAYASVLPKLLPGVGAGGAEVGKPAGGHKAGGKAVLEFRTGGVIELRGAKPHFVYKAYIHSAVHKLVDIHAAVGRHGKQQRTALCLAGKHALGAPALAAEGAQAHKLLAAAHVAQVKARGAVMIVHYGNSPLYLIYPLIYPCAALPF